MRNREKGARRGKSRQRTPFSFALPACFLRASIPTAENSEVFRFRTGLHQFLKIKIRLILPAAPHAGGQHLVRSLIFLKALGEYPAQVELVESPFRRCGEGLRTVTVPGICFVDPAAQLCAAPAVKVVEHRFTNELPIQADGEVHRQTVLKVSLCHVEKALLLYRAAQAGHIVITPPAVTLLVQNQRVICGNVLFRQGGEGQPGGFHFGDYRDVAHQLVHGLKAVLGGQLGGTILELGCPKAFVRCVVLPVEPLTVPAKGGGTGLNKGRIYSGL